MDGRCLASLTATRSTSKKLNIHKVKDLRSHQGWQMMVLQLRSTIHMCFTAQHTAVVPELLKFWNLALSPNALQNFALLMSDANAVIWPGTP